MAPSPRGLLSHLLPFQSETVAWMVERETVGFQPFFPVAEDCYFSPLLNLFRRTAFPDLYGGFLCSQFGLGKTVMVLALLLARREPKTLVVTSTSLLTQWQAEIRSKTDLECSLVHGHRVDMTGEVVLTTYGKIRRNQWRFAVEHFDRIVLDESHNIRNDSTSACKILSSLRARSRWCVTATPATQLTHLSGQLKFLTGAAWTYDMFAQLLRSRMPSSSKGTASRTLPKRCAVATTEPNGTKTPGTRLCPSPTARFIASTSPSLQRPNRSTRAAPDSPVAWQWVRSCRSWKNSGPGAAGEPCWAVPRDQPRSSNMSSRTWARFSRSTARARSASAFPRRRC
jgi:hypothetical protein